jgi:hypothetical protein
LRTHYFYYNIQVLISEDFMARFVADEDHDVQPVHEFVQQARVTGMQSTRTVVGFDLKPSADGARFEFLVNGQTHASTRADARQATVFSTGHPLFRARKPGHFDGVYFRMQPAHVMVNPNNNPYAVSTRLDGWPIIGHIARGIAMNEVRRRIPESNAITAQRMIPRIGSELDREIQQNLNRATRELQTDVFPRWREKDLYARVTRIASSERYMRMSSQVRRPDEPGGDVQPPALPAGPGITAHIHESFLNNAADRLGFHGRTMRDTEVNREIDRFLSELLGRDIRLATEETPAEEGPNIYIFDEQDPLRFRVDNGVVTLYIRAAFRDERRDQDIPPQIVRIPLRPRVETDQIHIERGVVGVAPVERVPPGRFAEQIARAGIIRTKIEADFEDRTQTRRIRFDRDDRPDVVAYVTRITALNGWLSIWAQ